MPARGHPVDGQRSQTRLRETLREDLSGTYGVNVGANYTKSPVSRVHRLDQVHVQPGAC